MEKILKYLMLMLVATFSLTFTSCGDDDEPESSSIVGQWTCTSRYHEANDTYDFKKNGTYTQKFTPTGTWGSNYKTQNGTYNYNGTILTLSHSSYTDIYVVVSISSTSMVIMDEDGDKYTYFRD